MRPSQKMVFCTSRDHHSSDRKLVEDATITVDGDMPQRGYDLPTCPQVIKNLSNGDYLVEGLRVPIDTVEGRLARARLQMRNKLKGGMDDGRNLAGANASLAV